MYGVIEHTETGIICGNCNRGRNCGNKLRHATINDVRDCYTITAQNESESRAEYDAEMATERHYEDRGYWETQAEAEWDRMRGVTHPSYFVAL